METISLELSKEEANALVFALLAGGIQLDDTRVIAAGAVGMPQGAQDELLRLAKTSASIYGNLLKLFKEKWPTQDEVLTKVE